MDTDVDKAKGRGDLKKILKTFKDFGYRYETEVDFRRTKQPDGSIKQELETITLRVPEIDQWFQFNGKGMSTGKSGAIRRAS